MVSTWIISAVLGAPTAGSHSRGIAMVPSTSYLPHASSLPVGSRWTCSGTMAQSTGASHFPVEASGGRALMVTVLEVLESEPAAKLRVCVPAPAMPRSVKTAVPLVRVVAVRVPCSVPVPVAMLTFTTTPGSTTPPASFTTTIGCSVGPHTSVSSAVAGGCRLMPRVAGVPVVARAGDDSSGRVTLSPLQVRDTAARETARTMRAVRRKEDMGPWKRGTDQQEQEPSHG